MQYHKFEGVIINRHIVKDADRFFTIFTKEDGKISVYAKGVRSLKSKRGNSLDLFSHINFEVFEKGEHATLTHVDLINGHHDSKGNLSDISRLFEIGELVDRLTAEHDPHLEVYDLLVTALDNLSRFKTDEYLYRFKKKLLELLGYGDRELSLSEIDTYIESLLDRPLRAKINP